MRKKLLLFAFLLLGIFLVYLFFIPGKKAGADYHVGRNPVSLKEKQSFQSPILKGPFELSSVSDFLIIYAENGVFSCSPNFEDLQELNLPPSGTIYSYQQLPNGYACFFASKGRLMYGKGSDYRQYKIEGGSGKAQFFKGLFYFDEVNLSDVYHPQVWIKTWDPNTGAIKPVLDLVKTFSNEIRASDSFCLMMTLEGDFFNVNNQVGYIFSKAGMGVLFNDTNIKKFATVDGRPFASFKETSFELGDGRTASICKADNESMINYCAEPYGKSLFVLSGAIGKVDSLMSMIDCYDNSTMKYTNSYSFKIPSTKEYPLSFTTIKDTLYVLFNTGKITAYTLP
jgi:hypothetical protein